MNTDFLVDLLAKSNLDPLSRLATIKVYVDIDVIVTFELDLKLWRLRIVARSLMALRCVS